MKIVTISREFGSGGRELGKRLADILNFDYYDREIITAVAQAQGMDENYVERACLVFILNRPRRFKGFRLWGIWGADLVIRCMFLHLTDRLYIVYWFPCMAGAVGMMFLLISICCDIRLSSAMYFTSCAFLTAEFTASLEWQLYSYIRYMFNLDRGSREAAILNLTVSAAVFATVFLPLYWLQTRRKDPPAVFAIQARELWPSLVISLSCFLMSNLSFVYSNTPFTSSELTEIYNIRTLVDLAGAAMLYAYHIQRCELYMQRELDAVQNILQNQYIQYKQSRESIDVVNRKYHDLKHQIAVLRAEQDPQRRMDFLDGMEKEINIYSNHQNSWQKFKGTKRARLHCRPWRASARLRPPVGRPLGGLGLWRPKAA